MNSKEANCAVETYDHINRVRHFLNLIQVAIIERGQNHDKSKLEEPELEIFANAPDLNEIKFDSKEYKESLEEIKPALENHYGKNSHHPQHYKNGINGMDLLDLCEMLCDWMASTERMKAGNIRQSLTTNCERFKITKQLEEILENTIDRYFS